MTFADVTIYGATTLVVAVAALTFSLGLVPAVGLVALGLFVRSAK